VALVLGGSSLNDRISMRALVIGADGLVGAALASELRKRKGEVIGTTRRDVNVTTGTVVLDLAEPNFDGLPSVDVVFICAAMTRFAECRAFPPLARRVNSETPGALTAHFTSRGARVVFLSTSAVFDCKEPSMSSSRRRDGVSLYGRYKAEAEERVLACGQLAMVVRLTKIVAQQQGLFQGWIESLRAGHSIQAFCDHRIAPITLAQCVDAIATIGVRGDEGIYQVSGSADVSYYDVACHFAARLDAKAGLVHSCAASERGIPLEEVLPFTSLDASRISALSGFVPPEPYNVLDETFFSDLD